MKNTIWIIGILMLLSCGNSNEKKVLPNYQEKELSFLHLRFGYDKTNNWIKKSENILMLHETFKKIGYKKLFPEKDWVSDWNWYLDVNKSPKNLIDSLELTFVNIDEAPRYYRDFWLRRKNEGNEKVVYKVVNEIRLMMNGYSEFATNREMANDTLAQLISFEYPERELTNEEANKLVDYLINIGLHQSAYNLVREENGKFSDVNWDKDKNEVLKLLNQSESYQRPWFEDDTK